MSYMRNNSWDYVPFVPIVGGHSQAQSFSIYLEKMSRLGEWRDNLTLQALSVVYKTFVLVLKVGQEGDKVWMQCGDNNESQYSIGLYLQNHHYENLLYRSQLV